MTHPILSCSTVPEIKKIGKRETPEISKDDNWIKKGKTKRKKRKSKKILRAIFGVLYRSYVSGSPDPRCACLYVKRAARADVFEEPGFGEPGS
jgi:hypothetical protein